MSSFAALPIQQSSQKEIPKIVLNKENLMCSQMEKGFSNMSIYNGVNDDAVDGDCDDDAPTDNETCSSAPVPAPAPAPSTPSTTNSSPRPRPYNIKIENVSYDNNFEYRAAIRGVFNMVCDPESMIEENPDYDDETLDEQLYDNDSSVRALDYIFEKTKHIPLFQKFYSLGAARLLSENLDLGMAVMFSYDLFSYFHECLVKFFKDGSLKEDDECVQVLISKI